MVTPYLDALHEQINQVHYIRIKVLDWNDQPIIENGREVCIEGLVTGGSLNLNGSSAIRRTGSLQCVAAEEIKNIWDVDNLISINKRIKLEIGLEDNTELAPNEQELKLCYIENNICWIKLGIFVITGASVSCSTSSLNISINFKDKMALLNGECGGTITNPVTHSPIYVVQQDGTQAKEPVLFEALIRTLVQEWGGLKNEAIHINNIDNRISQIVRWIGNKEVYAIPCAGADGKIIFYMLTSNPSQTELASADIFSFGDSIGYIFTDFVYPVESDLESNAGDSVSSVLDKIKATLGNFEYFYDINGEFYFQEIQNFLNTGSAQDNIEDAIEDINYLANVGEAKSVYNFQDNILVTQLSNNPQYASVKNDIYIWGIRGDSKQPILYHLAIGNKPEAIEKTYENCIFYEELGIKRVRKVNATDKEEDIVSITTSDWRTQIYLDYIINGNIDENIPTQWAKELENYWPSVYDIENNQFVWNGVANGDVKKILNNITYFFDIIDPVQNGVHLLEDFKISKIGCRHKVVNDDTINTIFNPVFPDITFIEANGADTVRERRNEAIREGKAFVQLSEDMYQNLSIGSAINAAYDVVRSTLHELTSYNNSISISCLPLYHLDVNQRITVNHDDTGIHGDYMIKSISVPLTYNDTMTIQATKAIERI